MQEWELFDDFAMLKGVKLQFTRKWLLRKVIATFIVSHIEKFSNIFGISHSKWFRSIIVTPRNYV